jgi:hypothetical protein
VSGEIEGKKERERERENKHAKYKGEKVREVKDKKIQKKEVER